MQSRYLIPGILAAVLLIAVGIAPVMAAEAPAIEWQARLGGDSAEEMNAARQTPDGGYILFGYSASSANGNVTGINHGVDGQLADYWVVKVNRTGAIEWDKLLGGGGAEAGQSVDVANDGGYFLAGYSYSSADGDVTEWNHGQGDAWVVKLDSTGAVQWDRLLGGTGGDNIAFVSRTTDGGCIITGTTSSGGSGEPGNVYHGADDAWVVKLSSTGTVQWERRLGGNQNLLGSGHDAGLVIRPTSDGGYILLAGSTSSGDGDVTGRNHGSWDAWLVKLDGTGAIQWERLIGGSGSEAPRSLELTNDGGFFLFGFSTSNAVGGKPSGNITAPSNGGSDFWAVKLDSTGEIQWQQLLGGAGEEQGYSATQTIDGGYILIGCSYMSSASGDVTGINKGIWDMWTVKLNDAGALQWQRLLGGDITDFGKTVLQVPDGGYLLIGDSNSNANGDITSPGYGWSDFWIVKLGRDTRVVALPGGTDSPTDPNNDGKYEDVNGNNRADFADVVLYFNQMSWIAGNEPVTFFDFNGNDRIDFADVVWLFNNL